MIKPELYHKTVDILYQAYFNDTLEHGDCYACAVGNMVAANCGYEFNNAESRVLRGIEWIGIDYPAFRGWARVFCMEGDVQTIRPEEYQGEAKKQIDSTGYTWEELSFIERAFENGNIGWSKDTRMFNGLVAVLEVLKEIHQVTDQDLLTANNKRFKDHYSKRVSTV